MGLDETHALNAIRISVGRETTKDDVDAIIEDIKQAIHALSWIAKILLDTFLVETKFIECK